MIKQVIILTLCLRTALIYAQPDKEIFDACIKKFPPNTKISITNIALNFIEKPYKSATLEINDNEQLVCNLREFDCSTFVESILAIYLTLRESSPDFETFKQNLTKIRYRNGKIDGYLSRLHYASDWISDNKAKKIVEIINSIAGSEKIVFKPYYMSKNSDKYPYLKSHSQEIEQLKKIEKNIAGTPFFYIPKTRINELAAKIEAGTIVFFVTSTPGLDISHLGIACRKNGVLTFIHASQKLKKTAVNPESLADYCLKMKSNKGIVLCKIM